jgi:uncharacterized protein YbbC (DUF1343 family)
METTRTGLENFASDPTPGLESSRLGLLCNPASVDRNFTHARHIVDRLFPGRLAALYSPQHGFHAEKQDNMVESAHTVDSTLGVPVYSLYG